MATAVVEAATSLPVVSVVVLEDRAQVTRKAKVELKSGRTRLVVEGLAPVAVDKSLTVAASDAAVIVRDARIVRTPVFERVETLDDEIKRARAAVEELEGKVRRLHREAYDTDRLLVSFLDEVAEDAAWARGLTAERRSSYEELVRRSRALAEKTAQTASRLDDERRALDRKVERRRALERPDVVVKARLEIDVEASKAAGCELSASYLVPNACWRPRHRVTLEEGKTPRVSVETEGVVWQNTGEDWSSVTLALSTERASLGVAVPRLETDRLYTQKKGALVVETREEEVEQAGLGAVAIRKTQEMPGIDDGGEAQHLVARDKADVPSDGRPHAVTLASFEAPTELELVTMPELASAAITKTTFANAGTIPMLAGPVDLVRRGGAAGRSKIDFIGRGEKVALGWGPDPNIHVHREIEQLKDQTSFLGSWHTRAHDVRVRLANLGRGTKTVVLKERVPVSEIEKVKVDVVAKETTDGATADKNGILTFSVELAPYAHKLVTVRVVTKKHADVVG